MKVEGKHYCDVSRVSVAPIAKSIAKDIIIKKHYTQFGLRVDTLGIYYRGDEEDVFGNQQQLIGRYLRIRLEQKHLLQYVRFNQR